MNDLAQYFHLLVIYDKESTDPIEEPYEYQLLLWEAMKRLTSN